MIREDQSKEILSYLVRLANLKYIRFPREPYCTSAWSLPTLLILFQPPSKGRESDDPNPTTCNQLLPFCANCPTNSSESPSFLGVYQQRITLGAINFIASGKKEHIFSLKNMLFFRFNCEQLLRNMFYLPKLYASLR